MLSESFHWIVPGKLAGAEKPTVKDLHMYKKMGFNAIVNLQEGIRKTPLWESLSDYDLSDYTKEDVKALGMTLLNLPVVDMKPPTFCQMDKFIEFVDHPGRVTLVHCYGGIGRTGCMVTAYVGVKGNICGLEALEIIREIWRPYIQTYEQEDKVLNYIDSKLDVDAS